MPISPSRQCPCACLSATWKAGNDASHSNRPRGRIDQQPTVRRNTPNVRQTPYLQTSAERIPRAVVTLICQRRHVSRIDPVIAHAQTLMISRFGRASRRSRGAPRAPSVMSPLSCALTHPKPRLSRNHEGYIHTFETLGMCKLRREDKNVDRFCIHPVIILSRCIDRHH